MLRKRYISMLVIFALLFPCFLFVPHTAHAADIDDLIDNLTEVYENLNSYERGEVKKANERMRSLTKADWNDILGEDVAQVIDDKTEKGRAAEIMESLGELIYATPNTDFEEAIGSFRDEFVGDFRSIFGDEQTLEDLIYFFYSFKSNVEAELISAVILNDDADFDEIVKESLDLTLSDKEFRELDEVISEHIGIGIEEIFAIKDRLNDEVDPDMSARTALIAGAARVKGASIDGPEKLKVKETGTYSFKVNFKGNDIDMTNKVVWNTEDSTLAFFRGNELHTVAGGKVIVKAEALGVTIMTFEVTIDGPPPKGNVVLRSPEDYSSLVKAGILDITDFTEAKVTQDKTGRLIANIDVDSARIAYAMGEIEKEIKEVAISFTEDVDKVVVNLPEESYKALQENGNLPVTLFTRLGAYTVPIKGLDLAKEAEELGVDQSDLELKMSIERASKEEQQEFSNRAKENGASIINELVASSAELATDRQTKQIVSFGQYPDKKSMKLATETPHNRVNAVVYNSETKKYFPIPTWFETTTYGEFAVPKNNSHLYYGVISSPRIYNDLDKHWAKEQIETLVAKSIISGIGENQFAPEQKVTRGELASMIARAIGLQPTSSGSKFTDVDHNRSDAEYLNAAVEANIINGYPDHTFKADQLLTREEVATIIIRAMKVAGALPTITLDEEMKLLAGFTDQSKVKPWAKASVAVAVKIGILSGYNDKTIQPQAHATRAEAAVMIYKMLINGKLMNP